MPSDRRSSSGRDLAARGLAEGLVLLALVGWWLTARNLPDTIFPSPGGVLAELGRMAASSEFWVNAGVTGFRILIAVVAATLIGTVLGLLPRYVKWTGGIVDDVLAPFFASFPAIAWAILGTLWFGVTATAIVFIQGLIIIVFCLVNVSEGAKSLGQEEVEMGLSFGRSRWSVFWRIELPLLSPFILAGARIAYGICWKTSLIAELFGARAGLGYLMQLGQDTGDVNTIVAICLAIVVFVIAGEWLILRPLAKLFDTGARAGASARINGRRRALGSRARAEGSGAHDLEDRPGDAIPPAHIVGG